MVQCILSDRHMRAYILHHTCMQCHRSSSAVSRWKNMVESWVEQLVRPPNGTKTRVSWIFFRTGVLSVWKPVMVWGLPPYAQYQQRITLPLAMYYTCDSSSQKHRGFVFSIFFTGVLCFVFFYASVTPLPKSTGVLCVASHFPEIVTVGFSSSMKAEHT